MLHQVPFIDDHTPGPSQSLELTGVACPSLYPSRFPVLYSRSLLVVAVCNWCRSGSAQVLKTCLHCAKQHGHVMKCNERVTPTFLLESTHQSSRDIAETTYSKY